MNQTDRRQKQKKRKKHRRKKNPNSETDEVCRFCLESLEGEPNHRKDHEKGYFRPCQCNSYLHFKCFNQWYDQGKKDHCEICQYHFQIHKHYKFTGWNQILENKLFFVWFFTIVYAIIPHLWKVDTWFGFRILSLIQLKQSKNITIGGGLSVGLCITMTAVTLVCTIFIGIPLEMMLYKLKQQEQNVNTRIKSLYLFASIPIFIEMIAHLIGYLIIHLILIPNGQLIDHEIFHGTSFLTFSWGMTLMIALTSVFLLIRWIVIHLLKCCSSVCCIIAKEEIKPYQLDLDPK